MTRTVETFEFGVQVKKHKIKIVEWHNDKPKKEGSGHGQHCAFQEFSMFIWVSILLVMVLLPGSTKYNGYFLPLLSHWLLWLSSFVLWKISWRTPYAYCIFLNVVLSTGWWRICNCTHYILKYWVPCLLEMVMEIHISFRR